MSYLVLARKYRPQNFEEVVGQSHITRTLQNAIEGDRLAHALIFAGPRGVGKTSVARIVAKAMNCTKGPSAVPCNKCSSCREITDGVAVDVLEIDGASNRGISEIRELRENIKYMPGHNRFKIYIIDEVHMLTAEAFNALLKTLEEPPSHVLFFFATTEAHKIPVTILSRCQRHDFRRIGLEEIVSHLRKVCEESSFKLSEESLGLVGREADGSMRDALSLLDQVMAYSDGEVTHDQVLDVLGAVDREVLFELAAAVMSQDAVKALNLLEDVHKYGHDLKRLAMQLVEHFRHLLLLKMGRGGSRLVDVSPHELKRMEEKVKPVSLESLNQVFNALFEAEAGIRFSRQPKIYLETLFIKLAHLSPVVSFEKIIEKLDSLKRELEMGSGPGTVADGPKRAVTSSPPAGLRPSPHDEDKTASDEDPADLWKRFVEAAKTTCPALVPSLEKSVLTQVGGDLLEITVTENAFHAARLRDKKSLALLQSVSEHLLGRKMTINIVESAKKRAQKKPSGESDKDRRLKKDALKHPLVTDAVEIFRGRVVDVKIL